MDYKEKVIALLNSKELSKEQKEKLEDIFPELKESEDEKIRKAIIKMIADIDGGFPFEKYGIFKKDALAWLEKQGSNEVKLTISDEGYNKAFQDGIEEVLTNPQKYFLEKQGEQKSTDKVEPKFRESDWLIYENGSIYYVNKVYEHTYELVIDNGDKPRIPHELIDKKARLWTIKDAKDGDVLCSENGWTCIFKALDNHTNTFSSYCFMDSDKWFCNTGSECHTLDKAFIKAYNGEIYPATKEQRDLLFQKMKEAGYEWDAEKKELKKIEQNLAWSEEDENRVNRLIAYFEDKESFTAEDDIVYANWLKSLKDRVLPQSRQEWSEEDKETLKDIITSMTNLKDSATSDALRDIYNSKIDWLKSIRHQSRWKPSDEQMEALSAINITGCISYAGQGQVLIELYNDLKKLIE